VKHRLYNESQRGWGMLHTRICDLLGIRYPIFCAPMGFITGPELAAAVSNAGGMGILAAGADPPVLLRRKIRALRRRTDRPFGVNVVVSTVRMPRPVAEMVAVCVEERIDVLSLFGGDPAPYVAQAHAAGIKVFEQVGSVEAARRSLAAGVDVLIVQGSEAGGQLCGHCSLAALLPRVVDAAGGIPVLAAGGIAEGRGVAAALALGADGAVLGTRFIATPESEAHPIYKRRLLEATETETTSLFSWDWPDSSHRVLRTAFVEANRGVKPRLDEPIVGETMIGDQRLPLPRFVSLPPTIHTTGDIDAMAMYAGEGVAMVNRIQPADEIVRELVATAGRAIAGRMAGLVRPSAAVSF